MKQLRIDIPDELHAELKLKALEQSVTIKEFVLGSLGVGLYESHINPVKSKKKVALANEIIKHAEEIEIPSEVYKAFDKTCKNGHPIPKGRDRCLIKGCKYA